MKVAMNRTWNKTTILVVIMSVFALLVSSNFSSRHEEKFRRQYAEERLQNDSLMGAVQTLQKQLWEKEQDLLAKDSQLDSLIQVCAPPNTVSNANQ